MKQEMASFLTIIESDITNLCNFLYENPEESFKEKKSSNYICELLKKYNFKITEDFLNIPNAFIASSGSGHPKICYLCEYDSVKNLGHITGHNALTTISVAAALVLNKIKEKLSGTVILIGCPGEYLGGSKNIMARQGVFEDIDVVMECHPDIETHESGTSKAITALKIEYFGESGLTYLNETSYTTLDALMLTINIINSISKGFPKDVYLNYVISNGGSSPSLIPEAAEAKYYIRADNIQTVDCIENKLRNISSHVSLLTGIKYKASLYEPPNEELITNSTLNRLFDNNLKENGIINIKGPKNINAGLSIGIVSKKVPCIHPYIGIVKDINIKYGTQEFSKNTISTFAFEQIKKSALALAFTGADIMIKEDLLNEIRTEFYNIK